LADKRERVRVEVFNTLEYVVEMYQPGPDIPATKQHYLELFSTVALDSNNHEFGVKEPWEFLVQCAEQCSEKSSRFSTESLLLKLVTNILAADLNNWYSAILERDGVVDMTGRPLVAAVIWPSEPIEWSKRVERLCVLYVAGVAGGVSDHDLACLRKLVSLAAQVLQMREREKKTDNSIKEEMARFLGREFNMIKTEDGDRVWSELFLLRPAWLSSLVSTNLLAHLTDKPVVSSDQSVLRQLVNKFIDTSVSVTQPQTATTPVKHLWSPRKPFSPRNTPVKSPMRPGSTKKKIKVGARNQFGETPLHVSCKKGDVERVCACLATPGVDINARDNNGWSPLHEAVQQNRLEVVKLLLSHKAHTLHNYFSPVATQSPGGNTTLTSRVDLLWKGGEDKVTPFHEAVQNNSLEVVSLFLETVAKEGAKFPGVDGPGSLLSVKTGSGKIAIELSGSDEMTALLGMYGNPSPLVRVKETDYVALSTESNKDVFLALLQLALHKYLASNSLAPVYTLMTATRDEVEGGKKMTRNVVNVTAVLKGETAAPAEFGKWRPLDLKHGLLKKHLGVRPRFDFYRTEAFKAQDLREYERLLFPSKKLTKMSADHPIVQTLKLLKTK